MFDKPPPFGIGLGRAALARQVVGRQSYIAFFDETTGDIANVIVQSGIFVNDNDCRIFAGFDRTSEISEDRPGFAVVLNIVREDVGIVGRDLGCNCSGWQKTADQAVCRGQTASGDNGLSHEFPPRQFTLLVLAQQFS